VKVVVLNYQENSVLSGEAARAGTSAPSRSDSHNRQGDWQGDDGDFRGALEQYKKAAELEPASPQRLVKLAEGYAANDLHRKAFELYQRALDARADQGGEALTEAYVGLGDLCRTFARSGAAVRSYERAVRSRPQQPFLRWKLAAALITMGLYEKAEGQLLTVVEQAPRDAYYRFALAELYRVMGRHKASAKCLKQVIELAPYDEYYRLRLGAALLHLGRTSEAAPHFEAAAAMVPTNPSYQTLLLYAHMRNKQAPEIAVDVDKIELGAYDEDFVERILKLCGPAGSSQLKVA
jgi:tetratricopeptide (TPR) repeat protein